MSINSEESVEADDICCANCGIAQVDDIKLKLCDGGCDLVKYCSDNCRENHREQHEEECQKRKAELHEKDLFEQPDGTHLGECPICFIPLPLDQTKYSFYSCCCKLVCDGCIYAHQISSRNNDCPFCREPGVNGEEKHDKRVMERVRVNDPAALRQMGAQYYNEDEYDKAIEYYTKAAEFGDAAAHNNLGLMYYKGEGVEKDEAKGIYHFEKAAMGGHPYAIFGLAIIEEEIGNIERSVKHYIIAANLGYEKSMKELWRHYSAGNITKEDLDAELRAHQSAIDATKSAQRDAGEA